MTERTQQPPREPTEEMITAGYQSVGAKIYPAACKLLWTTMYDKWVSTTKEKE